MDDQITANPNQVAKSEAIKKELQRRSLDTIRVYNPTDEDYNLEWDGFIHKIPSKSERSLQRYLAEKFAREIKNKMINEMADEKLEVIKKKLIKQGDSDPVYNANSEFNRQSQYRTDDAKLTREIYEKVWLGTEQKYGLDELPKETPRRQEPKPVEEEVLAGLDKPYNPGGGVQEPEITEETTYPINKAKSAVEEVSA